MYTAINEIMKFQTDRNLHKQEYNYLNEFKNIFEELLEAIGYDIPKEGREGFFLGVNILLKEYIQQCEEQNLISKKEPTEHDKVDAFGDIIVFSIGALMKLGYHPEKVLSEVSKEINSRVGSMQNGKFEKDLSEEAKSNWHKANFTKCKG